MRLLLKYALTMVGQTIRPRSDLVLENLAPAGAAASGSPALALVVAPVAGVAQPRRGTSRPRSGTAVASESEQSSAG